MMSESQHDREALVGLMVLTAILIGAGWIMVRAVLFVLKILETATW